MSALLSLVDAEVRYGAIVAVSGVSLEVHGGELVALLGSNGAGKSSLLRALSGLVPLGGQARFADYDLLRLAPARRVHLGLVHVPEGRGVFAPLSIEENLRLGGLRLAPPLLRRTIDEVYARFPVLAERRSQAAGTLSGGEQQMLALGRALCQTPRLLLLDEPSLGLAPQMTTRVFETIAEIHRRGTAILMVEQNARLALAIADRGYVLQSGRVVLSGRASELAQSDEVKKAYLGVV